MSAASPGVFGEGDSKVQAYCFRMCLTDHAANRIPFAKPEGYDAKQYELLARIYAAGWTETFGKFDPIPNHKTDTNNHGPFSTEMPLTTAAWRSAMVLAATRAPKAEALTPCSAWRRKSMSSSWASSSSGSLPKSMYKKLPARFRLGLG